MRFGDECPQCSCGEVVKRVAAYPRYAWCNKCTSFFLVGDDEDKPATTTFSTGAVRSADVQGEAYHLIHPIALRRLAARCAMGAERYGKGNWEKGMPISDLADHVIAHIYKYLSGDRSDDHLAAALWGCHAMCASEELWPELNKDLRGANGTPV